MDAAKAVFANEVEEIATASARSTTRSLAASVTRTRWSGAGSQITEFRAGHFNGISFVDHPAARCSTTRAIDPSIQERIAAGQEVRTFRLSISLMGDGFVEAIDSNTLQTSPRAGVRAARHADLGADPRGERQQPHRPVRLEEPARQPAVVRR